MHDDLYWVFRNSVFHERALDMRWYIANKESSAEWAIIVSFQQSQVELLFYLNGSKITKLLKQEKVAKKTRHITCALNIFVEHSIISNY